jgi:hypothetical protein
MATVAKGALIGISSIGESKSQEIKKSKSQKSKVKSPKPKAQSPKPKEAF